MKRFDSMEDTAKKVRFNAKDEPDKYGFTKKMHAILNLVEEDKSLDDADFEVTDADKAYYEECVMWDDLAKTFNGGKKKKMVRFVNDIDPD